MINEVHKLFNNDSRFSNQVKYYEMPRWYSRHTVEQLINDFQPERLLDIEFDFCEDEYKLFMNYRSRFVQCVTNDTNRCIFFNDFHNWVIKEVPRRINETLEQDSFMATFNPHNMTWTTQYNTAQQCVDNMCEAITAEINSQILRELKRNKKFRL